TASVSPSIISPNGDQTQEATNFSYTLNEDADVTVQVFDGSGSLIQTLTSGEFQTRGQHIAIWDGKDRFGQVVSDGEYQLTVTARGTVRAATQNATVLVDTTPPTLRLANLDDQSRVREANLTVEGLTDTDAVIQLKGDPAIIPVSGDGQFSLKRQLIEGSNIIDLVATDPAGNATTLSREIILVTKPPEVAVTAPLNDEWTNESLVTMSGTVPAGATLKINGQEAAVAADGVFEHEVILQEGDNILRVEAIDDVGNVATQEIIIHRKTTPPHLEVDLEDGVTYQQSEVQINGKTEPGALVSIGGQAVTVSSLGEFQSTVNLQEGENLLTVAAQDQAGNVTQLQRSLNYSITPPETELARVARNLPSLSAYTVPVLLSLPVLLALAYVLTRPVSLVVSADSNTFRPGFPEEGRFLKLAIDLSKAARTTVEIRDRRGNTVATLLHRRHRAAGQQTLHWNGYDDFGRVAQPGEYTVRATASTPGGTVTGTLNIAVVEDPAVHRQYLRHAPYHGDTQSIRRQPDLLRTSTATSRRSTRRR
ncbi:MAG: FlgD immunoglobulin-like domain containing protein, partial [Anaerolineae bacterium]|nr:FlgD immunoglobulin-like domain containing protein [Anaerolineae bacterium]